jgi:hypothetical protein
MSKGSGKLIQLGLLLATAGCLTNCDSRAQITDISMDYTVNGIITTSNQTCSGPIPEVVAVSAQLYKGNEWVSETGVFPANGPYSLTIKWPNFQEPPDGWTITAVTRTDGSPICETRSVMMCDPTGPEKCVDVETKVQSAAIGTPINWNVRCQCRPQ